MTENVVERYLALGLAMDRHIDGFVDAYYGPKAIADRVAKAPVMPPDRLVAEAKALLAAIDAGEPLGDPEADGVQGRHRLEIAPDAGADAARRHFLRSQAVGLLTTARKLAGEPISYADEVEACYGVRPRRFEEGEFEAAHRRLEEVVPGSGPLLERYVAWRESQAVPIDRLEMAIASLAEDLQARTQMMFGLPDGERVEFELVTDRPWGGFNYYLGGLTSRVEINTDLPVLSTSLAHLVAHEAYPGHHTEHARKEAGLVHRRRWWEESIAVIGTPQNLLAEGLADLGLEVVMGSRPEAAVAEHLRPLGISYDPDVVAVVREAGEALGGVRANAAFRLLEDRADPDTVIEEIARWGLTSRARAKKAVEFLLHPTWRAYISCYVEGLPLCRDFVAGDPARFARLVTEQLTPQDLIDQTAPAA
ncbi:MAG TPA: hypothetical protein VK217_01110 [Acidimicrobiales bacterium]|nr:hypothetical protein [Acidimicrobiales bacterium]